MIPALREELRTHAAKRADEHPALIEPALRLGMRKLRRRLVALSVLAIALAALPVVIVAARVTGDDPSPRDELTVTTLAVEPDDTVREIGTTLQLTALTRGDDGVEDVTGRARWASSEPDVVSVSDDGVATAVSAGTARVTASFAGIEGAATVVVSEPDETVIPDPGEPPTSDPVTLIAVDVTPATTSLRRGAEMPLMATATYSDRTTDDVTDQVRWSSNAEGIARVDNAGVVTAVAGGTASITAMLDGEEGSASVTVKDLVMVRLVLLPEPAAEVTDQEIQLQTDQAIRLRADALYSDDSTEDVTAGASWASSNSSIAGVDGGLVVARREGSVTISASLGDRSASTTVTVAEGTGTGGPEPVP